MKWSLQCNSHSNVLDQLEILDDGAYVGWADVINEIWSYSPSELSIGPHKTGSSSYIQFRTGYHQVSIDSKFEVRAVGGGVGSVEIIAYLSDGGSMRTVFRVAGLSCQTRYFYRTRYKLLPAFIYFCSRRAVLVRRWIRSIGSSIIWQSLNER